MKSLIAATPKAIRHYLPEHIAAPMNPLEIALIGAGGNGGQVLTDLGRMNHALKALGHPGIDVSVYDPDAVSPANVGRQLFSPADIGRNKAEVLVTRLNRFFGLKWKAYPVMVGAALNTQAHIIITAVDSAAARVDIGNCLKIGSYYQKYWIDLGNTVKTAQVLIGTIGNGGAKQPAGSEAVAVLPTVLDLYPEIEAEDKKSYQGPSCSVADALEKQDLFINKWVATAAIQLLWSALRAGYMKEHGAFVNLSTFSVRPLPVSPVVWEQMGWPPKKKRKAQKTKKKGEK